MNEIGFDTNNLTITLAESEEISISADLSLCKSLIMPKSEVVSGVSAIRFGSSRILPKYIDNDAWVDDFLNNIEKNATLIKTEITQANYFEPYRPFSKNFKSKIPPVMSHFSFFRTDSGLGTHQYYIGINGNKYLLADELIERKEEYRFIIRLYSERQNNTVKCSHVGTELFQINLPCLLPRYEYSLIVAVMWPLGNIDDKFAFIGRNCVEKYIEAIISHLGLVLKWSN